MVIAPDGAAAICSPDWLPPSKISLVFSALCEPLLDVDVDAWPDRGAFNNEEGSDKRSYSRWGAGCDSTGRPVTASRISRRNVLG